MTALLLLLVPGASAIEREAVIDIAAEFASHTWTMGANNETASCSSSYRSDFDAGDVVVGVPYDWGGWVTVEQFDEQIASGYGAGSHSWHGVLSCTTGVDCSGFVSQTWDTSQKYGTSTFYQVTTEISQADLKRADALNDAGSHIVLWAYETDAGSPVFYHAGGDPVKVEAGYSWSYLNGFQPVRYNEIEDGPTTGTVSNPIQITAFPYSQLHWTAGAASDVIDSYSCSPDTDESGPEVLYHFQAATGGLLTVVVADEQDIDVDVHVMNAPDGDHCLGRDDTQVSVDVDPGEVWISMDTWVGSHEFPGPYVVTATFTGEVGEPPDDTGHADDTGDTDDTDDTGIVDSGTADDTGGNTSFHHGPGGRAPGSRINMDEVGSGCGCSTGPGTGALGWLALLPLAVRRIRFA